MYTITYGKSIKNFSRELKWKRRFGRQSLRWEDNIKMDLKVVDCESVEDIDLG
jgi:hypothetical protein